jgi:putative RNA 2'-phosphotransferase
VSAGATIRLSKRLSWLLRHGAGGAGLDMDAAGWAPVDQVLAALGISRADLEEAVRRNDKGRLQLAGDRVRACQGHSLEGMPVTRAALEASWVMLTPSRSLWHGTSVGAVAGIAAGGLLPGRRSHVHLAADADARVGKRTRVDLLLEISPRQLAGHGLCVFRPPNGVLLVRHVPVACIVAVRAASPAGQRALPSARRALELG